MIWRGVGVVSGIAEGPAMVTNQSISFWGGVDPHSGRIHDPNHELTGRSVTGTILVFPHGKGSSTGSLMMLELIRVGKAPAAIVTVRTEPILATGPIVSRYVYGRTVPMMTITPETFQAIPDGRWLQVNATEGMICLMDNL